MQVIEGSNNDSQRIPEWFSQRLGRFSCSQMYRLMTEPRLKADKESGNLSDGAMTYIYECVAEKITGRKAKEDFTSKFTDWGVQMEPIAKGIYNAVFKVTIVDSEYIPFEYNSGGSPDGLIGDDGIIEVKCPFTITSHLEHKLDNIKEKPEYYWQCVGYLLITGRNWLDFVSYHPDYPGSLQMVKQRLTAAELETDMFRLTEKLKKANLILETLLNSLL